MAVVTLVLRSTCADAASFAPGSSEPDPPTGATGRLETPQSLPAGSGIRWELAPLRYSGTLAYDARMLRLGDGARSMQNLVITDIDFATYIWQPWFVQLRAGLGTVMSRDSSSSADAPSVANAGTSLTGRFAMTVFPVSRFPFELRADVSDSRVHGDIFGNDYRSRRLSVSQAYTPEVGNDHYSLNFDHSRLSTGTGGGDTVNSLRGTAQRQIGRHSFDVSGQMTVNQQTDSDSQSRVMLLSGRHTFEPVEAMHVDTLANWNQVRVHAASPTAALDSVTGIRQISSFATWRPREGQWLYSANSPLYLNASLRVVDARTDAGAGEQRLRAFNASLGATQELTPELRVAGGLSASLVFPGQASSSNTTAANASAVYTPQDLSFGQWRYAPSLGASLGVSRSSEGGTRHSVGLQATHGVSRSYPLSDADSLSLNLSQALSASKDSQAQGVSRAMAHSAGMAWQGGAGGPSQSYVALSASDSRTFAQESGSFQLVNLQVSRRSQLSRAVSWSGNLTLQASRSDTATTDAVLGAPRQPVADWQRFYGGSISYENRRVLGVPRLRFTALLTLNSQQLESRAAGDIDAPRERISRSIEGRFDYAIGRLETRLTARLAHADGRNVASVFFRVQRNF